MIMMTIKQGDSGGPLMLNQFGVWYLVGIVSAGYSCAKQYQPGIYHRVSLVFSLVEECFVVSNEERERDTHTLNLSSSGKLV